MTLEEYLGHLNDRLMLEISNISEMPEMYDWVVFQIVEKAIQLMKDDYVLLHKSHIETEQQYDMAKYGFLTRAMVQVYAVDVTPEIEILYSELSQDDLLGQHRDYCVGKLATYLEAPKPIEEKRNDA